MIDFSEPSEATRWSPIDDVVMGGVSGSRFTSTEERSCVFSGDVSLENGGGFASVWSAAADFGLQGAEALILSFRGDGKQYKLRLRTTDDLAGVSYQVTFPTREGVWMTHAFPFTEFEPFWRGRMVPGAPAVGPGEVRRVGFLISDGQAGAFRLEVRSLARS